MRALCESWAWWAGSRWMPGGDVACRVQRWHWTLHHWFINRKFWASCNNSVNKCLRKHRLLQWPKYCGRALSVSCVQPVQPWPSRPIPGDSPSPSSHSQPGHWVDQGDLLWEQARMAKARAPIPKRATALKPSEARVHSLCCTVLLVLTVVYYHVTTITVSCKIVSAP